MIEQQYLVAKRSIRAFVASIENRHKFTNKSR